MKGHNLRSITTLATSLVVSLLLLVTITPASARSMASACSTDAAAEACTAEMARHTDLADTFTPRRMRSFSAMGGRYAGLAETHAARASARQRARSAEAARYTALVSAQHLRADQAASARNAGLVLQYASFDN